MTEELQVKEIAVAIGEVKTLMDQKAKAWEEFKSTNDERLAKIEKNQGVAELEEKLNKISASMDQVTAYVNKPAAQPLAEAKAQDEATLKSFVEEFIRKDHGYKTIVDFMGAKKPEFKSLTVNSDPNGGYLVIPEFGGIISGREFDTSNVRQYASVVTISTDALEYVNDDDEASFGWVSETGTRSVTNTPTINKVRVPTHEMYANAQASQKMLDDSMVDLESWLQGKIVDRFSRAENTAFVSGNGVTQPRGMTTYSAWSVAGTYEFGKIEQVNSGGATSITSDGLVALVYALRSQYKANAIFAMNRDTMEKVRLLGQPGAGASGYLWQPSFQVGQPDRLLGYPVAEWNDLADSTTGSNLPIVFGDIRKCYTIVDRIGISMLRDPYSNKPFVQFYTVKRVGGDVVNFDGIKLQKVSS